MINDSALDKLLTSDSSSPSAAATASLNILTLAASLSFFAFSSLSFAANASLNILETSSAVKALTGSASGSPADAGSAFGFTDSKASSALRSSVASGVDASDSDLPTDDIDAKTILALASSLTSERIFLAKSSSCFTIASDNLKLLS